jgi:hypothetical protein
MTQKIISRAEAKRRGLKTYFTGRPCKRGHVSERRVGSQTCVECERQWRNDNPEYFRKRRERIRDD